MIIITILIFMSITSLIGVSITVTLFYQAVSVTPKQLFTHVLFEDFKASLQRVGTHKFRIP